MSIKHVTLILACALALAGAPVRAVAASAPAAAPAGSDPSASRRTGIVVATEKAAPAVVSITVRRSSVVAYGNPQFQDPFFDFFGPPIPAQGNRQPGIGRDHLQGRVYRHNGHVVGASEGGELEGITVTLSDGRQFIAKLIGADNANDLAVVRIQAPDLPVAQIQEKADNMIGEWWWPLGIPTAI